MEAPKYTTQHTSLLFNKIGCFLSQLQLRTTLGVMGNLLTSPLSNPFANHLNKVFGQFPLVNILCHSSLKALLEWTFYLSVFIMYHFGIYPSPNLELNSFIRNLKCLSTSRFCPVFPQASTQQVRDCYCGSIPLFDRSCNLWPLLPPS